MPRQNTDGGSKGFKIVPQGHAPNLELAFIRDGRAFAYLIPADMRSQECFDAMKEIAEIWNRKARRKGGPR